MGDLPSLDAFKAQFGDVHLCKGICIALTSAGGQLITQVDDKQVRHHHVALLGCAARLGRVHCLAVLLGRPAAEPALVPQPPFRHCRLARLHVPGFAGHRRRAEQRSTSSLDARAPCRPLLSQMGAITSKPLAHEMFRMYLGSAPVSEVAKTSFAKGLADIVLA